MQRWTGARKSEHERRCERAYTRGAWTVVRGSWSDDGNVQYGSWGASRRSQPATPALIAAAPEAYALLQQVADFVAENPQISFRTWFSTKPSEPTSRRFAVRRPPRERVRLGAMGDSTALVGFERDQSSDSMGRWTRSLLNSHALRISFFAST